MEDFDYFILARALHVIGVVIWIGGVAFVTTVLVPALKKMTDTQNRLELFEQLEGKFGFQAKIASLITGVSGYYMLDVMNAWNRYQHLQFWWMHSITARSLQSLKPNVDMFWKKCEPYYREPRISLLRFPKTTWQKLLNTLVT